MRRFERLGSTVTDQQPLTIMELVAFRMPAKVIMVVDNENCRLRAGELAEEVSCGQTTYAPANHDQVVGFPVGSRIRPGLPIPQSVRDFPRPVVAPSHPGFGRRVVTRVFLGSGVSRSHH